MSNCQKKTTNWRFSFERICGALSVEKWKKRKAGIKQVDEDEITFVKRPRSWRFERQPFVATFRLDNEADASSVSPSSPLSD